MFAYFSQETFKDVQKAPKTKKFDCDETATVSSASPLMSSRSDLCPSALSSTSSFKFVPQNHANFVPTSPTYSVPCCPTAVSTDTRNVSSQTVESSLVPCNACDQVQSILRQTGDAVVELCRSEGLPSSLQQLQVAMEDALELGHLTAGDVAQWAREQRRDMGRLGKHLQEVRGTVRPLRDRLAAAEAEREGCRSQMERAQEELKREMAKHQAGMLQLEQALQEAQRSVKETERRLQEEQQQLKRECEKNELQETLQIEEGARRKLEERSQQLGSQISETQLLLDKESVKYHSACRQQESMQAKLKSLLERVDALDQECEELQRQLGEREERQSDLQEQLKHMSEEKEQLLAQFAQQQVYWSALLQREKRRLETHVGELKNSVAPLREEVQDLSRREKLLVAFPELSPLAQAQPQSTGNVLLDMEQQLQANCIRIRVLEQENATLHSSLMRLRERAQHNAAQESSPEQIRSLSLPSTPVEKQHNHMPQIQKSPLKSSSAAQLEYGMRRRGADGGEHGPESTGSGDRVSTAAASPPSLLMHHHTLHLNSGSRADETYAKTRHAFLRSRSRGLNQRKK
ncbi:coiled-coil domain-containing protein 157-like [Centroberyx affinis]|uniref:coiled-coil domain-containing protein 157-like n=1 Tax=Centroberyx affinis TaxID=166261 RepID=UPI003A5BCDE6